MKEFFLNNAFTIYMGIGICYVTLCMMYHRKEASEKLKELDEEGALLNVILPIGIILLSTAWPFYMIRKIYRTIMGIPR